ncbi:MAG: Glu/Leu/Phe/Val dehydrogenase [Deltaproteobacteria bacterium]|nr:Glu/Leu/Phe/Val dehydrogenase [Deltaproteobacteria bacterium]MBW2413157.1 Glu/Leu/Phe/Val dehydrogenase [Deltaproteobacteria bacterium]
MSGASLHVHSAAGVEMIIAIDSTARGPALGGCRWRSYEDPLEARREARALAQAMTRKAALAGLALGGGKAVVCGDARLRTRDQLLVFGDFVSSLDGRYITAADMGTGEQEMAVIAEKTSHVVGLPRERGGCGDPGPFTALGVRMAMETALRSRGLSLAGARIAVQGVGSVGGFLVRYLCEAGAVVIAADPDLERLGELPDGVAVVTPGEILDVECDVLAPCGPARVIDASRADALRCAIVCGAANNTLAGDEAAAVMHGRGVLLVPDYLANAGGLIHLAVSREGGNDAASRERLRVIPENLDRVLARCQERGLEPMQAAEELVEDAL